MHQHGLFLDLGNHVLSLTWTPILSPLLPPVPPPTREYYQFPKLNLQHVYLWTITVINVLWDVGLGDPITTFPQSPAISNTKHKALPF